VEQIHQALGRAGGALQLAPDLGDGAGAGGDHGGVEHERRQLPGRHAAGEDVMAADPQDHGHRAEGDQHHAGDQEGLLRDARNAGAVRRLGMPAERGAVGLLVRVGLHRADLVHRLVDVGRNVRDTVLVVARKPPHPAPEEQDRNQGRGGADDDQERELPSRDEEHDRRADHHERVAQEHGKTVADDLLQHGRVVREARDHLARARGLEERRLEPQDVVEHRAAHVGDDALAEGHHEVKAQPGRGREQRREREHRAQRLVQRARGRARQPVVDHVLDALAEREPAERGDDQCRHRPAHAAAVGPEEARQPRQRANAAQLTKSCVDKLDLDAAVVKRGAAAQIRGSLRSHVIRVAAVARVLLPPH
jgi:hypothetical protein